MFNITESVKVGLKSTYNSIESHTRLPFICCATELVRPEFDCWGRLLFTVDINKVGITLTVFPLSWALGLK